MLISWRKLQAALSGRGGMKSPAVVMQHITNTTITQIQTAPVVNLDAIADGASYERVAAGELSSGIYKAASTSDDGIVELATSAETITGTDTARAVTPAGLAAKLDDISQAQPTRVFTTIYQNSTKIRVVTIIFNLDGGEEAACLVGAASPPTTGVGYVANGTVDGILVGVTFIVLPSYYYRSTKVVGTPVIDTWTEWDLL